MNRGRAYVVEVRIFRRPIHWVFFFLGGGCFCKRFPGSITFPRQRALRSGPEYPVHAGPLERMEGSFGIVVQRACEPVSLFLVASPSENSRAKVESPWISRVNLYCVSRSMHSLFFSVAAA